MTQGWETYTGHNPVRCDRELVDLVQQVRNRADIFIYLSPIPDMRHTLATLLEDMYEDIDQIMHDYCCDGE